MTTDVRERAGRYVDDALECIANLMRDAGSEPVKLAAARELLDRAFGKPRSEGTTLPGKSLEQLLEEVEEVRL